MAPRDDTNQEAPNLSPEEKNRLYAGFTEKHSGRLLPYFGIDPRRKKGGLEQFRGGVEERGMIGLKLHPTTGFYPNDPVCYPFYEAAGEMGVPVLIHSGTEPSPLKPMFSQPCYIETAAADFPLTTSKETGLLLLCASEYLILFTVWKRSGDAGAANIGQLRLKGSAGQSEAP
ncbi:MAG: amidohydrolase family protein [Actinomycetota bacterium]